MSASILAIAITTILTSFWWMFIKNSKRSIPGIATLPPGPRGLPVLGYLPFLGTHLHKEFTKLAETYDPIYKLRLGNKLFLVVSSVSTAREIVRDQDFANRDPQIAAKASYCGTDLAWLDYNSEWKQMRKVFVHEVMRNSNIDRCYGLRRQEVRKAIRDVHRRIGSPVNVGDLSFLMNINVVLSMLWGTTFEGKEGVAAGNEFREVMSEHMVLLMKPNISEFFPVFAKFDLQGIERQGRKIALVYDKFFDSAIRQCEAMIESSETGTEENNEKRKDVLRVLLELRSSGDSATSISTMQLKGLLADIVIGGANTTSTTIEWTMAELINNPEIMRKVHQEHDIDNVRLHPALPLLETHRPSKATRVVGYTVPIVRSDPYLVVGECAALLWPVQYPISFSAYKYKTRLFLDFLSEMASSITNIISVGIKHTGLSNHRGTTTMWIHSTTKKIKNK